jgi:transcriptional regulator with XRE-family HTH domain
VKRAILNLRSLREARGLSQQGLAKAVGVRQATISDLETGKSQRISFDLLAKLAQCLKVRPADLFVEG